MKLYAEIDDINYDDVVDIVMKQIESGKTIDLPSFVTKIAGKTSKATKFFLRALPEEKKNEIVAHIIMSKEDEICRALEHKAEKLGLGLKVSKLKCKAE